MMRTSPIRETGIVTAPHQTNKAFLDALKLTLHFEGGKVDDPDDPGGRTAYGVTQRVYDGWRKAHTLPVRDVYLIEPAEREAIYLQGYWRPAGCQFLDWPLAALVFDAAVNHGRARALQFLRESDHNPVKYLDCRVAFYHRLAAQRPVLRKYLKGWLNRADALRRNYLPQVKSLDALAILAKAA